MTRARVPACPQEHGANMSNERLFLCSRQTNTRPQGHQVPSKPATETPSARHMGAPSKSPPYWPQTAHDHVIRRKARSLQRVSSGPSPLCRLGGTVLPCLLLASGAARSPVTRHPCLPPTTIPPQLGLKEEEIHFALQKGARRWNVSKHQVGDK